MAPLTFSDTHNMVAFLSKSDTSEGFDQIMDFLNAHTIKYALVVNPTIYVSYIKQLWATGTVKKVNDDVQLRALIDGKKEIFTKLARMGYEKPPLTLTFYKAFFSAQWKFLIHTLGQCLSAKRTTWNEFSCSMASAVICLATCRKFNFSKYIFDSMVRNMDSPSVETHVFTFMLVQPQPQAEEEVEMHVASSPPALQDPTPTPHATPPQDQPLTPHASPPQDQLTTPHESSILLLTTSEEEGKEARKEKKSKHFGFKRLRKVGTAQRVESFTDTVLETNEEVVAMDVKSQEKLNQEGVSVAEPTVFDDEDVTMTMAQTLIKLKAKKAKLLDEPIAQKLHDEEYDDKEENIDWSAVAEQVQERHLDSIKKYQNLKKKPVSIAQARKNMIIYLKSMASYKMEYFRRMTYDKVRPIFEREYKKVQTLFKPDKDVQEPKTKRVTDETLLQDSFKKLRATEVSKSESTQEIPSNDSKEMTEEDVQNMLEIVPVPEFKVEALQVKYPIIDWEIHTECSRIYWKIIRVRGITEAYQIFEDTLKGFDRENLVALWNFVKEKFSSAVPSKDKEKALWFELKRLFERDAYDVFWKLQRYMHAPLTWKLYTNYGVHHVSSTRGHGIFMLTEKDYPLSNGVMILMLSGKLQVE
nr:ribonuclease H-like domain, reverse transcriptase, RNA-dependent DNA polymerase [Tanacetum cinerariifolium]